MICAKRTSPKGRPPKLLPLRVVTAVTAGAGRDEHYPRNRFGQMIFVLAGNLALMKIAATDQAAMVAA